MHKRLSAGARQLCKRVLPGCVFKIKLLAIADGIECRDTVRRALVKEIVSIRFARYFCLPDISPLIIRRENSLVTRRARPNLDISISRLRPRARRTQKPESFADRCQTKVYRRGDFYRRARAAIPHRSLAAWHDHFPRTSGDRGSRIIQGVRVFRRSNS